MAQWQRICLPMEEHWLNPWSGRTLHATEQLSPCVTTIEPELQSLGTATSEACVPESPRLATRETTTMRSLCTTTRGTSLLAATKKSPRSNEEPAQPLKKKDTWQTDTSPLVLGKTFRGCDSWIGSWRINRSSPERKEGERHAWALFSVFLASGLPWLSQPAGFWRKLLLSCKL